VLSMIYSPLALLSQLSLREPYHRQNDVKASQPEKHFKRADFE